MNLNLDLSAVPRFLRSVLSDLRQKRLWSSSATPPAPPQAAVPTAPPASGSSIPALNVQTTPSHSRIAGPSHDPFAGNATTTATTQAPGTSAATGASSSTASSSTTGTATGGTSSTGSPSTSASTGSSSTTPSANPPSITSGAKSHPAPSGLKATQAYDVALAITNGTGGINTTDPLERLSVIPSQQQPMLVELGVEQGGNHVLFAVQPGAIPSGPGKCTPGPIDCEVLSLGQDQTEQLSKQTGSIGPAQVALFAITSITASDYPSAAAANKARRQASAAGRALLDASTYPTLSLFQYEPSLGSVVDLRNLKVGG
jgi:hypothetical protein